MAAAEEFSKNETVALKEFRANLSDLLPSLKPEYARDEYLIRWLRARESNVDRAEEMFRNSMRWRQENELESLRHAEISEFLMQKLQFTSPGNDKQGSAICVIPAGTWDLKSLLYDGYKTEMVKYVCQVYEKYANYAGVQKIEKKMTTKFVVIMDLDKFVFSEYASKQVLGFIIELLRTVEANNPETLKTAYIVNAPKIFSIFFALVKPFLTERTLQKIRIYGGGPDCWKKYLTEAIEYDELPSYYGGSNTTPNNKPNQGVSWPQRPTIFHKQDFHSVEIPAGEKFFRNFELQLGGQISWNFKTTTYDIGFEVRLNGSTIFPFTKTDAHICTQQGLLNIVEPGEYSLVFDNSYSRYRSKTLDYAIRIDGQIVSHN